MVANPAVWEYRLLTWAEEALASPAIAEPAKRNPQALGLAYDHCARVTSANSRTFFLASSLLPAEKRQAARALYAFCRTTDDLVDAASSPIEARRDLKRWYARLVNPDSGATDPVPLAWADTRARFTVPRGYADQLIAGVTRDLTQQRYQSFAELTEYCYGVASTVGLMVMHIIGFQSQNALPYAVRLGIALQLTNILRDIGEDWRRGRLYMPLDELTEFGLAENDIAAGQVDDRWRAFMRFQIGRVRRLFAEAVPGIQLLNADGRFAIAAAAQLYRAVLDDIEAHDYDTFHRRAYVSSWGKLHRLPRIWWDSVGAYGRLH